MDFGGPDYDWETLITRRDPLTDRDICYCCWFGDHDKEGCKIWGCKCICTELPGDVLEMRIAKSKRTKQRKKTMKDLLGVSLLQALNPEVPEKKKRYE
jgi:hypothetical protein